MLKTTAVLYARSSSPLSVRVDIANVGGGAISAYRVRETDGSGKVLAEASLNGYPRWAEPVGGLVARGMQALWKAEDGNRPAPSAELERVAVETRLGSSRLLFAWTLYRQDGSWTMEVWSDTAASTQPRPVTLLPTATWREWVVQGQCWATWGGRSCAPGRHRYRSRS